MDVLTTGEALLIGGLVVGAVALVIVFDVIRRRRK